MNKSEVNFATAIKLIALLLLSTTLMQCGSDEADGQWILVWNAAYVDSGGGAEVPVTIIDKTDTKIEVKGTLEIPDKENSVTHLSLTRLDTTQGYYHGQGFISKVGDAYTAYVQDEIGLKERAKDCYLGGYPNDKGLIVIAFYREGVTCDVSML